MNSLWSLTLLFTLCSVASWVSSCSGFISPNMRADVQRLKVHYKTNDIALFGKPIFPLDKLEQLLLQEILDVYVRILSDMQNQTKDMDVKKSIIEVRGCVEDLRNSFLQTREQDPKIRLQDLFTVKTNDLNTQRQAVRELLPLFQAASQLRSRIQKSKAKRRKRRQAAWRRILQP